MKILAVDDSSFFRNVLSTGLGEAGHTVRTAIDGPTALAMLEEIQPDLVTLDVDMPDMCGFEVCERIRQRERDLHAPLTPVVFVTGNDTLKNRERGFELGALDFITKNVGKDELISKIQDALLIRAPLTGLKALVVDDSDVARHVIMRCLRAEGLTVMEARNGVEAYKIAEKHENDLDLIITDVVMPEMSGTEFCQKVRKLKGLRYVPLVFVSGLPEKDSILELFRTGGTDHLIKPFAKEELLAHVRVHLEVRQLNRTMERQIEELTHLNKLKTDLLAVTSHDLRSPLNGILGVADVMGSDPTLSAENKEYVGLITQSGEQLLAQIGDLLDLAKAEAQQEPGTALPTAPVNLLGTLDTFLATFRKQATKKSIRVELANSFADSAPTIAIPASELSRIVNNLLSNALKFTPQGGDISVTVRHAKPSGVEIVIADTGIGIPPEKIPLLFNRYSKTSRPGTDGEASTGLGLSIVKDLITRNDGRIEVTSVEGKGTTFTVFFPIRN